MNRPDDRVRLGRQDAEKVIRRFAFPDLPNRRPARPDAGEKGERPAIVEREPNRRPRAVRQNLVFGEARERNDAATFDAEPSPPVRRGDVADIGDAGVGLSALQANIGDGMPQRAMASSRSATRRGLGPWVKPSARK